RPEFEPLAWNRTHTCFPASSEITLLESRPMIVSGVGTLPDPFASGTGSASALAFKLPTESAARYSCRPMVPAPESFWKFTLPFTRTESTMDDPAPGRSMRRGVLDALSGVGPGGTKYGMLSAPVPLMKLYTSTLKMACPSPHAAASPARHLSPSHLHGRTPGGVQYVGPQRRLPDRVRYVGDVRHRELGRGGNVVLERLGEARIAVEHAVLTGVGPRQRRPDVVHPDAQLDRSRDP